MLLCLKFAQFVTLLVWHFVFAGAVLTTSSVTIDSNTFSGLLTANDLGLIFTGAFGSVVFAVSYLIN